MSNKRFSTLELIMVIVISILCTGALVVTVIDLNEKYYGMESSIERVEYHLSN